LPTWRAQQSACWRASLARSCACQPSRTRPERRATYGLDLVARYPGRVRTLVAHEPPVFALLPYADRWRVFTAGIRDIYRKNGVFAAMRRFQEGMGFDGGRPRGETPPEAAEAVARTTGNLALFAGRLIPMVGNYLPDVPALRASPTRIIVGVGEASTPAQAPYRAACALAQQLGVEPAQFPGDHGGFGSHPDAFAAKLRGILSPAVTLGAG
jgi:hypothetical protein